MNLTTLSAASGAKNVHAMSSTHYSLHSGKFLFIMSVLSFREYWYQRRSILMAVMIQIRDEEFCCSG
jgi:hypothetical protein